MRSTPRCPWFVLSAVLTLSASEALAAPGDFAEPDVSVRWSRAGEVGSSYGWAIADVGDVNRDGARELAVGAPFHQGPEGNAGRLELVSGLDGELLWSVDGEGVALLGYAMADAGDVDGDGTPDVIIGAVGANAGAGRIELRSGLDGALLLSVDGPEPMAAFGAAVAGAGQLDEDGLADVVVGASSATSAGGEPGDLGGGVWALSGADGAVLWSVLGAPGDRLGSGVAHVGDVDDDGVDDVIAGARDGGDGRGYAWVLSGVDGGLIHELAPDEAGGDFGWFFVAGLDDMDDDGVPELYVGDFASSVAGPNSGRVHVYSGASGAELLTIPGEAGGEGLGCGRGAGDVDDDGIPDLLVGAYSSSVGANNAGRALVFSGADGSVLRTITSLEPGEQLGFDAVGLGDVDRDGGPELAIAAASGDYVYLIAGQGRPGGDGDGDPGGDGDGDPGGDGDGDPGGDGDGDGDPSGDGDGDTAGSGETTGGAEPGVDEAGGDEGCGCRETGATTKAPILVFGLLVLTRLALRGRRRLV